MGWDSTPSWGGLATRQESEAHAPPTPDTLHTPHASHVSGLSLSLCANRITLFLYLTPNSSSFLVYHGQSRQIRLRSPSELSLGCGPSRRRPAQPLMPDCISSPTNRFVGTTQTQTPAAQTHSTPQMKSSLRRNTRPGPPSPAPGTAREERRATCAACQ